MRKDYVKDLFKQYNPRIQELVDSVLSIEQEYISYDLRTNSKQLQEIKHDIKQIIDRIQNKNEA